MLTFQQQPELEVDDAPSRRSSAAPGISDHTAARTSNRTTVRTSNCTAAHTSDRTAAHASDCVTARASDHVPARVSGCTPARASDRIPARAFGCTSTRASGHTSAHAPNHSHIRGTRVHSAGSRRHIRQQSQESADGDAPGTMKLVRMMYGRVALQSLHKDLVLVVHATFDAVEFGLYVTDAFPDRHHCNKHRFVCECLANTAEYCGRLDIQKCIKSNPQ